MNTKTGSTIHDTLNEWGKEALEEQARERAALDAENLKRMQEQEREEMNAARRDFDEETRRLEVMLKEDFVSPEGHARLCATAQKNLDEKLQWIRTFGPGLLEVLKKK